LMPHPKIGKRALLLILIFILPMVTAEIQVARADQPIVRAETFQLNVGDSISVHSNLPDIQQVFLEGNLTAASVAVPSQYPTDNLLLNASAAGTYDLRIIFNQSSAYYIYVLVRQGVTNMVENSTSYYVSGGSFELDLTAYFSSNSTQPIALADTISPWGSFTDWMGSFSQAFPDWVKALYLLLAVQFFVVGGIWIRRESARKEGTTQQLDAGERAYLWLDILYKLFLTAFVAIVAIMGGELVLLFVLRFMFLASITLLSLWDLFVVGFALGAVILAYLLRFVLEKGFDLKPFESE